MLFCDVDIFDPEAVDEYFKQYYPRLASVLGCFRLMGAKKIQDVLANLDPGVQFTLHAFPGQQLVGNAYAFPRFLRVEGVAVEGSPALYRVTREKAVRDRMPALMTQDEVVQYYYELADVSYLQAEEEIRWAAMWPPEKRFGGR